MASILNSKYTSALPNIVLNKVPSEGTEVIVTDTKKLHDILIDYYQKDVLSKIFVRNNVELYLGKLKEQKVSSRMEAESLKDDMHFFFNELRFLEGFVAGYEELRLEGEDIIRQKF